MGAIISAPIAIIVSILATRPSDLVYWYKWITCYTYIQSFRRLTGRRFDVQDIYVDHDPVKTGFISAPEEIELESPLEENEIYSTADEIFFYGVNSKSECLVTRISRNTNHEAEAWIYLKLANGKLYQLRETSGYQQSCSEKKIFTCGDLQMNYVLPMRTWRIFFNGLLREVNENDTGPEKMVHVKFALLWRAASDVFDFASDVNAKALAKSMAKVKWTESSPPLEKVNKALNFYAQCGIIAGTINIGDSDEEQIYLFGERLRFLGDSSVTENRNFSCNLGYCVKDGNYIHLSKVSIANAVEDLEYGFIVDPVGKMFVVSDATIEFDNIAHEVEIKNDAVIRVHADDNSYDITTSLLNEPVHLKSKESWNGNLSLGFLRFEINFKKGFGILIDGKNVSPVERKALKYPIYKTPTEIPLCVHFTDSVCQDSSITGGKGSSLGKLTELSKELKNFSVPPGMVVTTAAYDLFQTNKVYKKMNVLLDILYGDIQGDLQEACERVMQEVIYSDITNAIRNAIESCLQHSFPDRNAVKFAVRSSATGEDTEQMSAAGQMETFLGVTGDRAILTAVKKCWASKFRNIAVQYKKQYGQIINTPMAVVIQEMVPCDVAGVLFTCDPLTGNPSVMSITANYGLGESVVSASEEPDTIELERDVDDNVTIKKKIIGAKRQRIILQSGKGTSVEEVSEKEREACCLSDEMILRLASLAIKIEKSYRSHRDIEWGFWKNNLYIFQSRPVTSGTNETDFEIEHEADGPMRIEKEYFSVCNVGEVMPGAMSTLGLDIILNVFRLTFQRAVGTDFQSSFKPKYFLKGISCMYNRVMFYLVDIFEQIGHDDNFSQSALINFFGRAVEDEELSEIVKERYGKRKSRFFTQKMLLKAIANVWTNEKALKKGLENFADYRIPVEKYKTSEEMFNCLLRECSELTETMGCHMLNSDVSSLYNSFVIGILTKARGELNADVYNDFARLLMTSSEVESADVPASIDRLACYITKEINPEEFKKKDTKEIIEWLEKSKTDAGKHFREFLKKHGHRCLKEFDVRTKTYGMDPTTLIQSVKNLVGSAAKNPKDKREEDLDKIFAELGLSLGLKNRTMLKFLIPRSRKGVQNREASKSLVIKSLHAWRKGYYHLAKLMVREGRIPDEDILFFMNLDEIRELINTRSPKIISRAHHRRRHFPIMDKHMFPEIMKGFPKPINIEDAIVSRDDENFSMKGIPVSQGVAKAFVRVALTLDEAAHLKPGEILVTYSTDIGWSPYFPILAGVVTEIGGLISHGAVVSREYGLPCIAGLHGATMQFQTGDFVLLDGYKGILKRLTKPDNLESTT